MFTKRSFKVALLGIALFALLALASHNLGVLAALVTPTPASGVLFNSSLPTPPGAPQLGGAAYRASRSAASLSPKAGRLTAEQTRVQ